MTIKNTNSDMKNFVIIFIVCSCMFGCENKTTTSKERISTQLIHANLVDNELDSIELDSILYFGKKRIPEITGGKFSYNLNYYPNDSTISITSKSKIAGNELEYNVFLHYNGKDFVENQFHIYDEEKFRYFKSTLSINQKTINLTEVYFANLPKRKVYPAGMWHWSIESSAVKYYKIANKEFFLINGADLYCNGSHCTSYQVYVIAKEDDLFSVNALYFKGLFPYTFENTHFLDIESDGNPEIFVPKSGIKSIKGLDDFDIYTVNEDKLVLN